MLRATLISNSSFGDDYIDLRDALQRFLRRLLFFLEEKYFIFRSVLYYSEKMLDFAVQKGEERYEANALHNMASVESRKKNYDESLALNKRSLAIREEIGDKKGMGRSLANIGMIYKNLKDYANALIYSKRALMYFEEINENGLKSHVLTINSSIYSAMGDLPKAIKCAARSLKIAEQSKNILSYSKTLLTLSGLCNKAHDYTKAIEYADKAKEICLKTDNRNNLLVALLYRSQALIGEKRFDEALAECDEMLSIIDSNDIPSFYISAKATIGDVYEKMGDFDKALEAFTKVNEIMESSNIKISELQNAQRLGHINRLNKNWPEAIKWCTKAFEEAEKQNLLSTQIGACECLFKSYKGMNDGSNALVFHEKLLALKDSRNLEDAGKKLQQMEFQQKLLVDSLEQVKKDRVLEAEHADEMRKEEKTRNILIGSSLLVLLLAGSIYMRLRYVRKSKAIIESERDRSDNLLLNILPADIAKELKEKGKADARDFDLVSILFTDFKSFTQASEKLTAAELVGEINVCFEAFDAIMEMHGVEKIKTIGDAYMAAGGLPVPTDDSLKNTVLAVLDMQTFISKRKAEKESAGQPAFEMRCGIHTGPVVAGIVGVKKFQYDIWGDTVNTASRMESHGEVGKVNISQATYELLKDDADFTFESRGMINAKGKGEMEMLFVSLKNN